MSNENEVKVAINSPEVQHCSVRALSGRPCNIIPYTVSQAVDNLVKKNPRVPMML